MRKFNPGEIVEVAFPFEENNNKKVRPALVLYDYGESFLVVKITSQHKKRTWDIEIPHEDFNGLTVDSVIQVDKLTELNKTELCSIIPRGSINSLQLAIVKQKLEDYRKQRRS